MRKYPPEELRIIRVGESVYVSIPKKFRELHNLHIGDALKSEIMGSKIILEVIND